MAHSTAAKNFTIQLTDADTLRRWLTDSILYGSDCALSVAEAGGSTCLQLTTRSEFSDGFLDLEKLFGRPVDLQAGGYLNAEIYVPRESWIATLKFNARDMAGNFGGFREVMNNFPGRYDAWLTFSVPVADLLPDFTNWVGTESPLARVEQLSFNPYCAHQASPSSIYIRSVSLRDEAPAGADAGALLERKFPATNAVYHIDFDDDTWLREQIAYRSFESSAQAFGEGIGGNASRAIRLRGEDHLNNIAWLPILTQVTGAPVDFTRVDSIYFRYYLPPETDDFDGSHFYLTSEHWDDILLDTAFYADFKRGSWERLAVAVDDLQLERVRGELPRDSILRAVHELRFNINYFPDRKNVEMWIDDFGWK